VEAPPEAEDTYIVGAWNVEVSSARRQYVVAVALTTVIFEVGDATKPVSWEIEVA
jgi:hypothetical protein